MTTRQPHPTATFKTLLPSFKTGVFKQFENSGGVFTYKARTALFDVFNSISKHVYGNTVLVPAFHCPTVVDPIIRAGFKIEYYGINQDISINIEDFSSRLNDEVAAVVVINFFGFEEDISNLLEQSKNVNALVVEDCSHSVMHRQPLQLTGSRGDIAVYSFWKMIPSMIGGGYRVNTAYQKTSVPHAKVAMKAKPFAKYIKTLFGHIAHNAKKSILRTLLASETQERFDFDVLDARKVSSAAPSYPVEQAHYDSRLPWFSKYLIKNADLASIEANVVSNYEYLLNAIKEVNYIEPIYKKLPERTVPWAVPLMMKDRSLFDFKLLSNKVSFFTFGEELHETVYDRDLISEQALVDATVLSNSILCLSVHQNIGKKDRLLTKNALLALFGRKN